MFIYYIKVLVRYVYNSVLQKHIAYASYACIVCMVRTSTTTAVNTDEVNRAYAQSLSAYT